MNRENKDEMMQEYKKGGCTKKTQKFAAGGVAKVRLEQTSYSDKSLNKKKNTSIYY